MNNQFARLCSKTLAMRWQPFLLAGIVFSNQMRESLSITCCEDRCLEVLDGPTCETTLPNLQCPVGFFGECSCAWTSIGNATFRCLAVLEDFLEDDDPTAEERANLMLTVMLPILATAVYCGCLGVHIWVRIRKSDDDGDNDSVYSDDEDEQSKNWWHLPKTRRKSSMAAGGDRRRSSVAGVVRDMFGRPRTRRASHISHGSTSHRQQRRHTNRRMSGVSGGLPSPAGADSSKLQNGSSASPLQANGASNGHGSGYSGGRSNGHNVLNGHSPGTPAHDAGELALEVSDSGLGALPARQDKSEEGGQRLLESVIARPTPSTESSQRSVPQSTTSSTRPDLPLLGRERSGLSSVQTPSSIAGSDPWGGSFRTTMEVSPVAQHRPMPSTLLAGPLLHGLQPPSLQVAGAGGQQRGGLSNLLKKRLEKMGRLGSAGSGMAGSEGLHAEMVHGGSDEEWSDGVVFVGSQRLSSSAETTPRADFTFSHPRGATPEARSFGASGRGRGGQRGTHVLPPLLSPGDAREEEEDDEEGGLCDARVLHTQPEVRAYLSAREMGELGERMPSPISEQSHFSRTSSADDPAWRRRSVVVGDKAYSAVPVKLSVSGRQHSGDYGVVVGRAPEPAGAKLGDQEYSAVPVRLAAAGREHSGEYGVVVTPSSEAGRGKQQITPKAVKTLQKRIEEGSFRHLPLPADADDDDDDDELPESVHPDAYTARKGQQGAIPRYLTSPPRQMRASLQAVSVSSTPLHGRKRSGVTNSLSASPISGPAASEAIITPRDSVADVPLLLPQTGSIRRKNSMEDGLWQPQPGGRGGGDGASTRTGSSSTSERSIRAGPSRLVRGSLRGSRKNSVESAGPAQPRSQATSPGRRVQGGAGTGLGLGLMEARRASGLAARSSDQRDLDSEIGDFVDP